MKLQFIIIFLLIFSNIANAKSIGDNTGFKLPRFVSTKYNESNLRIGANKDYPLKLTYNVQNFPIEIIQEYDIWRKVKDINNNEGWMHKSQLQGKRYGVIKTLHNQSAQIYNKPEGKLIGKIGNRNIVKLNKCFDNWCHINIKNNKGWINKINIWGVYDYEEFNMPFYHLFIKLYWKII